MKLGWEPYFVAVCGCWLGLLLFLADGESETCPERVEREKANEMVMREGRKTKRNEKGVGFKCGKVKRKGGTSKKRKEDKREEEKGN